MRRNKRTSFGATAPPFIDYLKDILRRYPDGGQILKELIQNADDAQATEVVFIHDERTYGTETLWTHELQKYQGPALYAYNNAAFADEDWAGIQAAGRSVKRNDPNKVGRFGIGFNSVYHITDVPSIFSSGHLGMLDPQEKIFGERDGGFLWSLDDAEHQETLMAMHDQFQPFRDIAALVSGQEWSKIITEDQHFNGTIFRFPLRSEASEISDNLYSSERVVQLFDSFIADAELSLLFMKNVTSLTLINIDVHGSVNTRLEVKSSVSTDRILETNDNWSAEGLTRFIWIALNSEEQKETKWLVTTCTMKEGNVEQIDSLAQKLSFFPRVDLAFPCGEKRDCADSRLSCFLPLPNNEANKTGLPVYVNACFGLTDNRRHIKWQEDDQKHDEHAVWNELLMKEVLPQAYIRIIQDAITLAQEAVLPIASVYDLWPDIALTEHKEKWHAIALDVLRHLLTENLSVLSLAKDERRFITPLEAVFPCNGPTSPDMLAAIKRVLVSGGENLVNIPSSVARAVSVAFPHPSKLKYVTPVFLKDVLDRVGVHGISRDDKLCLLEYMLSNGEYTQLKGLELLPLSDGSFRSFTTREEDTALIDSAEFPRLLLPCCKHLFIPDDLSPTCSAHLKQLARRKLFNVINIDAEQVRVYTRRYMPEDWKQTSTGLITWDIGNSRHPPLAWLQEFWKFLNAHFKELRHFLDMPLIPVSPLSASQPVLLARVQQNTTLIFKEIKRLILPEQIAQLVNKVDGTVVQGNEWLKHEDLDSYVLSPSPKSVVRILMNVDLQHLTAEVSAASPAAREELKEYLSRLDSLSDSERCMLLKLPVFQSMGGLCVAAHMKQAVLLSSGLTVPKELPMPETVVQCATESERRLLQLLQINILDTAQAAHLLIDHLEGGVCSKKDTEEIMTWILQHGGVLFAQNPTLKRRCKDLEFIEVDGVLRKTSSLFDPNITTFKVIFDSDFFPPPLYLRTLQMHKSLLDLGLINKEAQVSPEHLLHAATLIGKLHTHSQSDALGRAQMLLKLLDTNSLLSKFSAEQLRQLKMLKWVPCGKPDDKSQRGGFFCPDEIRHSMYEDLVGHVMPLTGKLSDDVSNKLGLKCLPPPEKVVENLTVLKSKTLEMYEPDTNLDFKRKLHRIYKHMQDHISEFSTQMSEDPCWLWSSEQFVSPRDLVLDYPHNIDLSAYIKKLPKEFLPYKTLLSEFGLRKQLSDQEIVDILFSIKEAIEKREQAFATSSEIKVSIEILNWLWREKKSFQEDIPVPVIAEGGQYTLQPQSTTVLCDISKKGLKEFNYSDDQIYILHEEIPKATAEWLDIQLLSTYILDPDFVGIEQCGQSEPITMRIKNILKEYDEDSDIFKELIQNAEDAGAKACKFLMDFRVHKDPPESLIDPDMSLCQGPCLWAFNDEMFTAEDWDNIVKVGAASKEDKVEKIGKFGLGFNTVYHVTDVPSILSGSHLLILDPNVTHLKKHIKHKTNPGIKLNLSHQRHFQCFPGQFGPYEHICGCSFTMQSPPAPYQGTLIKLPFRTEEEARKSEISKKVYDKYSIRGFQHNLTDNSKTHLLFLKNIKVLSLENIPNHASAPPRDEDVETVFTISKSTVNKMRVPDETHVSKQSQAKKLLMKLGEKCQEVIDCSTVSIVQIRSQQSSEAQAQTWLLYNCFGTAQALKIALEENKQAKFSLPIGGVAVPLQNDPETGKLSTAETELNGQAFCFLPLSIHTGLPVNVNGTFAVTSNRKSLWESGLKHDWNKALLQDPVVTAYVTALLVLKEMCENDELGDYCYHKFWPDREKVSETFKPLVDRLYSIIADPSIAPELFSDDRHWCSMNNAIFLHESIEEDESIHALAIQVCQRYARDTNHHVISLPLWLRKSFKQTGHDKVLQDRTWNWEKFYEEAVFANLATMDPENRDRLILKAIDLNIQEIDHLLISHPCIPTTDNQLQYIGKLVNTSGKGASLFEDGEGRLLGGTKSDFRSPKRIQRLIDLGMANDDLPLEDIVQKAGTIITTWSTDQTKAYRHLKCLLELMRTHMYDEHSHHWDTLRSTEFLPAFAPGDSKTERNVHLKRPTDVFSDRYSLLVNMTQHVLDHSGLEIHNNDLLLRTLRIRDSPEPEVVLQQLQEAQRQSEVTDKAVLHQVAAECYRFLDHWLCDSKNPTLISQRANSFPFVLVGNTFVNVNRVAEKEEFEAKPYLRVLPPAFASFRNLWECVGVEKNFSINQFLTVLQELHTKYGKKRLPKTDLAICLTILNRGIYASGNMTSNCLVPDRHGVLQPANKLFFNDSPWMPLASGVKLCHENIPRVMALHFGIKTTRHHTLQSHVVENMSPFAFQFEQQEQLTLRIKNIITAYPSKKDILKELLQNADDAQATEIHFIWDKRQHCTEKTFGEKWKSLQGPAFCVFNNKVFSDADLDGIQQLGAGGKHNSPGKTGKYGIGFNSVYHLTDCPSILTGDDLLCISDPNQNYIESLTDQSPAGIGYKLADTFKEMYIDVYNSFLPDNFPLKEGTMFRLPLRVGAMAESSKISQHEVTEREMEELCSVLCEDPEGLILFLKNISKIEIHEIRQNSTELKSLFAVEKTIPSTSRKERDDFTEKLQKALHLDKPGNPQKTIYGTVVSTSDKRQTKWIIAEQFGTCKASSERHTEHKLPQAAVAARVHTKVPNSTLLPASHRDFKGEAFCSLPLPGTTGLPVHVNGNFEVDSARRGLWKEDGQSWKCQWNTSLKQNVIAPLYADLLQYISSSISGKHATQARLESLFGYSYLCFWPTVAKDVGQEWHEMILEVYRSIQQRGLKVIPVMRSSTRETVKHAEQPVKEYHFDWCDVREADPTKMPYMTHSTTDQLNHILEDLGMKLVPYSTKMEKVWTTFKSAGIEVKDVHSSTVRAFLRAKPLNDPKQTSKDLPLPIKDTLIGDQSRCSQLLDFCLIDLRLNKITEDNSSVLSWLPLLLTTDKVLQAFNTKTPKLISRYSSLFMGEEGLFADYHTNNKHMDVLATFHLVENLTVPKAAQYLKPLSQRLLQQCDVDQNTGLHVPDKDMSAWLKLLWKFLASQMQSETSSGHVEGLTLSKVKELFTGLCILPVVCPRLKNEHFLSNMKDMSSVIPLASDKDISGTLFKLGFMRLDIVFIADVDRQLLPLLNPGLLDVNDRCSVLDQLVNIKHTEFLQLTCGEIRELQNILQTGVSKAKDVQEYQRKLKSLPLFETVHGKRVRIDGPDAVFVLNTSAYSMTHFPDLFTLPESSSIFLKNNPENLSLSQTLNIQTLTDMQYLMRFILPAALRLTEGQMLQCFKLLLSLQHDHTYPQHKDTIISTMKAAKVICNSEGRPERASYFFDDNVELYKAMLPPEKFVPERFWTDVCDGNLMRTQQAHSLVRELGMKHVVSEDDIIQFAKQIEKDAKEKPHVEMKNKSSLVFSAALKLASDKDKVSNILESIADIKFIFPVRISKNLCDYHQPFVTDTAAVKLRGSLIESDKMHQQLIWTSMPIIHLPVYKSQKLQEHLKNLGVVSQPPPECVTRNMSNICLSPCGNEKLVNTRAEVFRSCFTFLLTARFESPALEGLPVILVENDTKLVRAIDTSLSLPEDLEFRPYLYKIPSKDVMFAEFFKKIGVTEEPTAVQYCNVLSAVYADSSTKPQLNPNQDKTVKRAVQQLFLLLKTQGSPCLVSGVDTLYLPAVDGKVHPSITLYYNDTVFEIRRLEAAMGKKYLLLQRLRKCHLGADVYEHHQLIQLLPPKLQPQMLSQLTEEKIVESHMQLCDLRAGCEFSGWFRDHLSSMAFRHGLICLIREQSGGKVTQEDAAEMCEKAFGSIQIICCKSLRTELWLARRALGDTARDTDVYVKRGQKGCTFYLKHNDNMLPKVINEVNMTLTKEITALLGNKIRSWHFTVLGQLLMCDSLQDVQQTLAKNGIQDSPEPDNLLFRSAAPGTEIPQEWHDCLDMSILNNFEVGEYVGYSVRNRYIYAVITEELSGHSKPLLRRYKIQVGEDEEAEVSCLDLYQLKREKKPKPEDTTPADPACMELELLVGAQPHSSQQSSSSFRRSSPTTIDEAKKEIDKCLEEIWTLPEEERHKAIRRMFLRWHPDKNPDCESLANEAFKYLKNRIDELSKGKGKTSGSSSSSKGYSDFRDFYQQWSEEAWNHRSGRERFSRKYHSYNFWTHNANIPKPNREEARRWCRQARCDLNAARKDTGGSSTEWCLFKVHQAVEKSLIAVEYKNNGHHPNICSISALAEKVCRYRPQLSAVPQLVRELKTLGVDDKKTQYPNCHPFPHIPNERFRSDSESRALDKAAALLRLTEAYVD